MKKALTLILLCLPYAATMSQPALPAAVKPLLTSTWGQRAPYNFMCPLKTPTPWGGYQPDEQHCRVGCVAVAMGQIMRYHRWPAQGEGSNSVVYPVLSTSANTFSVDFAEATYDWDNMIDDYSGDYTEAEGRAVAELLYHCAVASNMLFEKTFSFSTNFTAGDALVKYFHYDGSRMQTRMRSDYSRSEWLQMIREELSCGRPIFYEAISISLTEGIYAHSFVIDGYNADGLVHGFGGRHHDCQCQGNCRGDQSCAGLFRLTGLSVGDRLAILAAGSLAGIFLIETVHGTLGVIIVLRIAAGNLDLVVVDIIVSVCLVVCVNISHHCRILRFR